MVLVVGVHVALGLSGEQFVWKSAGSQRGTADRCTGARRSAFHVIKIKAVSTAGDTIQGRLNGLATSPTIWKWVKELSN